MNKKVRRVRATDLADMGFCEMKCYLKATMGEVDTAASAAAKRAGNIEHERFHAQVSSHHNATRHTCNGSSKDKRCFIASAVYGLDDPRTNQLRQFRDEALLPTRPGRLLVKCYYRVSPSIADSVKKNPWILPITRNILDLIRRRIASITSKDANHEHVYAKQSNARTNQNPH